MLKPNNKTIRSPFQWKNAPKMANSNFSMVRFVARIVVVAALLFVVDVVVNDCMRPAHGSLSLSLCHRICCSSSTSSAIGCSGVVVGPGSAKIPV